MSLKRKLSLIFCLIITLILIFSNTLYYFSTRDILIENQKNDLEAFAKQIGVTIEYSERQAKYFEDILGEKLRIASIAIKQHLPPNYEQVTNEELVELSKELGISHITLFKQENDDIIGIRSSDPKEINLSSKGWGYWFTAMQQLLTDHKVTIAEGQKLPNYWTGPIDVASSNPEKIAKWGYYFDGRTNYIINPYIEDIDLTPYINLFGPEWMVERALKDNEFILEITGFNPKAFGAPPIYTKQNGYEFTLLGDKAMFFGSYTYVNKEKDLNSVLRASETGELVSYRETIDGADVLKIFIPIEGKFPYVLGVVTDYTVIKDVLNNQLFNHLTISMIVLLLVIIGGFFLAEYIVTPIHLILQKVNEISSGNFSARLNLGRKDELGLLSEQVNVMSQSLEDYKEQEERFIKSEKLSVVGQLAAGVAHEIRNPLTALMGFTQMLKEDSTENRFLDIMSSELNRIETIVSELLMLAKPQATYFHNIKIKKILEEVITLIETQANMNNIQIMTSFDTEDLEVNCDENQLKQVFINILKNAIEAMPQGGNIYIDTSKVGELMEIQFTDEGSGISPERIAKLGEPFYTTKEKGTGLGLMICQKIIQNHLGKMEIQSQIGEGTIVDITLPVHKQDHL